MPKKKRKLGRPPTGGAHPIRPIRMTDREWQYIRRAARKAGISASQLVRDSAKAASIRILNP